MTAAAGLRESAAGSDPRHAAVWRALADVLAAAAPDGRSLTIVDAGGGSGGYAVPLAARGHRVTVVDPSPDALAALRRRAADAGVAGRVAGHQGDLGELAALVGAGSADLLLCHSVLDRVDDPPAALRAALAALRPGGWLSLLVAGRAGAVLARALSGRADDAIRVLGAAGAGPGETRRFDTAEVRDLATAAGAEVVAIHGVRVFADLAAPASMADGEHDPARGPRPLPAGWADRLAELEEAVSARPPYRDIAAQLHLLARRPDR